jgi:hypothetical protein
MMSQKDDFTYHVAWSEEDGEYIGLCDEFPSLSWLAPEPEQALEGIRQVVADSQDNMSMPEEKPMHERMMDKTTQPSDADMIQTIGQPIAVAWSALRNFLAETYEIAPIFNSGGKKYGWNLQYRIGARPLCEMYPENGSFTALVILGRLELEQALNKLDTFGVVVQKALLETPRFHDGCWMYIRVSDPLTCQQDALDIQQLILIKRKSPKKSASPRK